MLTHSLRVFVQSRLRLSNIPVLNGGPWVLAAAHSDHDDGEEEEKAGQGETHPVHRLVANNNLTIYLPFKARYGHAFFTKSRYLRGTSHDHDQVCLRLLVSMVCLKWTLECFVGFTMKYYCRWTADELIRFWNQSKQSQGYGKVKCLKYFFFKRFYFVWSIL